MHRCQLVPQFIPIRPISARSRVAAKIPADTSVGLHGRMRDVMDAVQGGLGHGLINAQPKADLHEPPNVRFWGNSGQRWILAHDGLSALDP